MDDGAAPPLVLPLASVGAADLPGAGGKGANLGELVAAGLPVPAGFVVTTAAYRAHAARVALDPSRAASDPAAARDLLASAPLDAATAHAVTSALTELGPAESRVAVRSSATAEDLPGAAFAGQQDTFLDVTGPDAVLDAVRRCWVSLWTDRAADYRKRQGIDPAEVAIAVVVQRMVAAEAAGVLFTADPLTGRRDLLVVDAARGLGEAVVSGQVTPEHLVLNRDGAVRERTPGEGGGRVLSDAAAHELARLAVRVEQHFGVPQDIEWALAEGRISLLQARPMTALPLEPPELNRIQQLVAPFFVEMFTVRPYPLDVTGWIGPGVVRMLHLMAGSVGVRFPPLEQLVRGRDGVPLQLVPPRPRPSLSTLGAPLSVARRVRRFDVRRWREDPLFAAFRSAVVALDAEDPATLDWQGLLDRVDRCNAAMEPLGKIRVRYLPGSFVPFLPLRALLGVLGLGRLAPRLVAGGRTRTRDGNDALEALAAVVRADPELARAARELAPAGFLEAIRTRPEFAAFAARLDAFLTEYGHRESVSIVMATAPTWRDDPLPVAALLTTLAEMPPADRAHDPGAAALAELLGHPALRSERASALARGIVEACRRGLAFREDTHFYITALMPPLRATFLELGRRLAGARALVSPEDVFHLRLEELRELADPAVMGDAEADRVRGLAARRARLRREYAGVPMLDPSLFGGRRGSGADAAGALLAGTPASAGVAEGPVRIVLGSEGFADLRTGEVLVCPNTNPSWTPLFARAAAVVVDTGGLGSHAAIVAREYGVPAVMGTRTGTSVLRDGQRVRVDGSRGRVDPA
ncbi:PEP/pyruvate-binding domain-containing protein [Sinomonas sp. R1AF57]|uniref:PEP/pyruvate-binding domain-containing protein n=1 Tax=Sinomonas sp. R1AF57 TaxID=2020377 RepID=UPI000B5DE35C|nr:PEP/pyruvate-binding domain-containing protein [Sinomonas sp. R1AF57]ASN51000.1 phosphoenolpyruvate synthase [Sinomonas sp. R1AF57]